MRKQPYLIFVVVLLFSACNGPEIPKDVLTQDKMKEVLWDMFQAQAWAQEKIRVDSSQTIASETKLLSREVFRMHDISEAQFQRSYEWYRKHPEILGKMLDSLYSEKSGALLPPMLPDDPVEKDDENPVLLKRPRPAVHD